MVSFLFCLFALGFAAQKPFPSFPASFYVEFSMALPQWQQLNLSIAQSVKAWFSKDQGVRLEYWSEADPVVNVKTKELFGFRSTWLYIRDRVRSCRRDSLPKFELTSPLPAHTDSWIYQGPVRLFDVVCDKWTRSIPINGANNSFAFFADATTAAPVFYSYRGDTTSTAGFLHSPNYDAFDVTYSSFKPGSFNQSVFEHPCQVESISKPSGGFDASEFARHLDMDGDSRIFVPKMKMEDLPTHVDWDAKGFVVGVKDQGDCGSCYTFGSTAAVESAFAIKHGTLPVLSEQVLLDCSWEHGNHGCWGGSQAGCYKTMLGKSWPREHEYTLYRQNPGTCKLGNITSSSTVKVVDYKYIVSTHAMMEAVALHGPVAVAISTYPSVPFTFYSGGVFSDLLCNPLVPDHVVLVVGYGTDEKTGQKFWRLKNQWSSFWGENGFMRITRTLDDCGVVSYGVLPIVE